jgi:pimeloyl-ACP methyl ester carboxylesterase
MSYVHSNGIRLWYQRAGHGEPVLLIMGSGAAGHVWDMHQVPALRQAGYQTVIFNNRGIPPSDAPTGKYSLAELVDDTKGLIEALDLGPCRILGTSLGAMIAQELAVTAPDLVRSAVLMATRARSDTLRREQTLADRALLEGGVRLPPRFQAVNSVQQMLSPRTLNDDAAMVNWLELFELSSGAGVASGQAWIDTDTDRRQRLREIAAPCRVIAFGDDVIAPPHLCAEVADAIPKADLVEIPGCGHLGHLEQPDLVNAAIVEFFDKF